MDLMTVDEVAEKLKVSAVRVYQYINLGILPAKKFGKQWAIDKDTLKSFKKRRAGRPSKKNKS